MSTEFARNGYPSCVHIVSNPLVVVVLDVNHPFGRASLSWHPFLVSKTHQEGDNWPHPQFSTCTVVYWWDMRLFDLQNELLFVPSLFFLVLSGTLSSSPDIGLRSNSTSAIGDECKQLAFPVNPSLWLVFNLLCQRDPLYAFVTPFHSCSGGNHLSTLRL